MSSSTIKASLDTNLTTKPISKPELVTALKNMVDGLETDIAAGGGGGGGGGSVLNFSGTGDPGLTRAEAILTNFTSPPETIRTLGYDTPGDYGGALYKKVSSLPAAPLTDVGTFTTADGSHYLMVPTSNDVYVNAFGAKSHASSDFSFDNWQAFEYAKYWIISQSDPSNQRGMTLRIAPGCYYLSKAFSIEGCAFSLVGSGRNSTMLRFPWNQDGIQVQHCWSTQSIGHEGAPFSAGATYQLGMIGYWPGNTSVYVCTTAGTMGSSPPTGTGTGITTTGGTAVWAYVRELTYSESRNSGASDGVISDMTLWSRFDRNRIGIDQTWDEDLTVQDGGYHSGIVMRTRCTVTRVFCAAFPGHGIAVVADGDPEIRGGGNVNQWRLDRVSAYWNGHDGIHIGLADANAGVGIDIDVASNIRWGVNDASFLGNRWLSVQSASDGTVGAGSIHPGMCTHQGYIWLARVPGIGGDPVANYANEPGTDSNSWVRIQGDGQAAPAVDWPVWSPSIVFRPNGAFASNNINAPTQWYGLYIEDGTNPPQFATQNAIFGGIGIGNSGHGEQVYNAGWSNTLRVSTSFNSADGTDGFSAEFGPHQTNDGARQTIDSTVFWFQGGGNPGSRLAAAATTSAPTITGSIADVVTSNAAFHGQIGVGDAIGANVWQNILFVTSIESGTVIAGQEIAGPGIAAGTRIGAPSWWPNSYNILPGDGVPIGTNGTGAGGITNEAMTSQFVLPVLTVTTCPTDAISLGASLQGGGLPFGNPFVQIAKQLDPTTLANVSFTGGVGKYALSCGGHTVASTSFSVWPNGTKNIDFALSFDADAGSHVWGWTGNSSKRKFGRTAPITNTFFARQMILGEGQRGMDDGQGRLFKLTGGAPDNGGDYKTGEWRFNYNFGGGAGTPLAYVFLGAETGIAGTPKWLPFGSAS